MRANNCHGGRFILDIIHSVGYLLPFGPLCQGYLIKMKTFALNCVCSRLFIYLLKPSAAFIFFFSNFYFRIYVLLLLLMLDAVIWNQINILLTSAIFRIWMWTDFCDCSKLHSRSSTGRWLEIKLIIIPTINPVLTGGSLAISSKLL